MLTFDLFANFSDCEIIKEFKSLCSHDLNDASVCFLQLFRKLEDLHKENESMSNELSKKNVQTKQLEKKLNEIYEKEEESSVNFQKLKNETYIQKIEIDEIKKKLSAKEVKCEMLEKSNRKLVSVDDKQKESRSKTTNKNGDMKLQQQEEIIARQKEEIKESKAEFKDEIKKLKEELKIVNRKRIDSNNEITVMNYVSKLNELKKMNCLFHKKDADKTDAKFINFRNNFNF